MDSEFIQLYSSWLVNNKLIENTKTISLPGGTWVNLEDLSSYNLSEPPRVYIQRKVSGDRWVEAGAASPAGNTIQYKLNKNLLQVQDSGAGGSSTLRYKIMTKGMG